MPYCEQGSANKVRSTLRKSMIDSVKEGGTMAYMPPERFGKDNIPIKASDIWAMGATVFELLTGDLPFGAAERCRKMVVQKKSDKRWGIIDREGNEVEAANYDQVSARLKNGYYALKNDQGWVVFDTSLKKVATGLEKLDEYQ